jgi:hypothetical protein
MVAGAAVAMQIPLGHQLNKFSGPGFNLGVPGKAKKAARKKKAAALTREGSCFFCQRS